MGIAQQSFIENETRMLPFKESIDEAFDRFHAANPDLYHLLVKFARQVKDRGYKRYSMDAIFHRVRWHYNIETTRDPDDEFKLNNNLTSRYARLIMEMESDLRDFFETRVLKS
jgi:hypothetical protein